MTLSEQEIQEVVRKVVARLGREAAPREGGRAAPAAARALEGDGLFARVEDAVEAAFEAQRKWAASPLELRRRAVEAMRRVHVEHARELAEMAVQETGMGRVEDKVRKNIAAATRTPGLEDIPHTAYSGDRGITLEEYVPYGVIASITPCTNPSETVVNNAIMMLAAGNAVCFNFHPAAKRVSGRALSLLNGAITSEGGPPNLLTAVASPTIESGKALMNHPKVAAVTVTGGGGVVKAALASGKRAMTAGPGNPPVIVDDTCDLDRAAEEVVRGASLDNNIICTAEKECFVLASVADEFLKALGRHGARRIEPFQLDRILRKALDGYEGPRGKNRLRPNRAFVGRNASVLAKLADLTVPDSTRLLVCEVGKDHPLVQSEQLMPVFPVVRVEDFETAVEWAVEAEHGYRHTAVIHSNDLDRITRFAKAIDCSIFVANGPNFAGLGIEGEGPTAWTITTPTGEGCTTPRNFCRKRRFSVKDALRIY